jgi:hypothetical protein
MIRRAMLATVLMILTLVPSRGGADQAEPKVPRTAQDHATLAKSYADKTDAYRKEAALHREMAAAYRKSHPDTKGHGRNPWTVKMEKHCQAIARAADAFAAQTEKAADYHALRAKELQGQ